MDIQLILQTILVSIIPLTLGIILHEVAHAVAANYCGDDTAKKMGRITLNPVPHIDPMGTLFFVLTAAFSPFVFGWAKPVPVNPRRFTRFKEIKSGMLLVSLAGPLSNVLLSIVFLILFKIYVDFGYVHFAGTSFGEFLKNMLLSGIIINAVLAFINLIPIPPLDGSHIIAKFLPYPYDAKYMSISKFGMMILLLLIVTDVLGIVINEYLTIVINIVLQVVN